MKHVTLYEAATSDGYRSRGCNQYYLSKNMALAAVRAEHGDYAAEPIRCPAVTVDDAEYFLLKAAEPVVLAVTTEAMDQIRADAMAKLSPLELEALGLCPCSASKGET